VVKHLLGAVVYTLLPNKFTWEPFRNSPVKGRVMTEATYDALADCRANRGGLNGDRREDDPVKPRRRSIRIRHGHEWSGGAGADPLTDGRNITLRALGARASSAGNARWRGYGT
jgi:hypothetical protein